MTTMTHAPASQPTLRVTQPRVLLSEWTKFRSLRSTVYTLLTAVVLSIGGPAEQPAPGRLDLCSQCPAWTASTPRPPSPPPGERRRC